MIYAPTCRAKTKIHQKDHFRDGWSFDNAVFRRISLYEAAHRESMTARGKSSERDSGRPDKRTLARGAKALIVHKSFVLILREPDGRLDLPGGRLEAGEGLKDGLRREVLEETGLIVKIIGPPIAKWSFMKTPTLRIDGATYLCTPSSGTIKLSREHVGYFWCGPSQLEGLGLQRWLGKEGETTFEKGDGIKVLAMSNTKFPLGNGMDTAF